ncbi:MAG: 2-amino-4-hydroxy-6-hydroxymethyldihydropteridine diphosphokinase [Planctomycetes bacterium]|nr:2-amino-4-hydroxy-6-hydroxymethyldihydropteridine diphosphokinase [Planctomycetota bacterium]
MPALQQVPIQQGPFQQGLIAFGANLGDAESMWNTILADLRQCEGLTIDAVSSLTRSRAVGGPPDQPDYVNAVIRMRTSLDAYALLQSLLELETRHGRSRSQRWSPRTVDLDLLLLGQQIIETSHLSLPHPRLALRSFVLRPAVEIAADMIEPRTGKPLQELWNNLRCRPFVLEFWGETAARRHCTELLAKLVRQTRPAAAAAITIRGPTLESHADPPNLLLVCRTQGCVSAESGVPRAKTDDCQLTLGRGAPVLHLDLAEDEGVRRELSALLQVLEE